MGIRSFETLAWLQNKTEPFHIPTKEEREVARRCDYKRFRDVFGWVTPDEFKYLMRLRETMYKDDKWWKTRPEQPPENIWEAVRDYLEYVEGLCKQPVRRVLIQPTDAEVEA
jgi:hypothetical protein